MHDSLVKVKDIGFFPDVDIENATVFQGSRLANFSERLSDLCTESRNNLFVIDVGTSCRESYVQRLCEMGFSSSDAIEALSRGGNDLNLAITFLTMNGDQSLTGNDGVTQTSSNLSITDVLISSFLPGGDKELVETFKQHADRGNGMAQVVYGMLCFRGMFVSQDKREACRYLKMAADQGDSYGQTEYGHCLFKGEGVSQDKREAVRYLKMSVDQGDSDAQYEYGLCLFK